MFPDVSALWGRPSWGNFRVPPTCLENFCVPATLTFFSEWSVGDASLASVGCSDRRVSLPRLANDSSSGTELGRYGSPFDVWVCQSYAFLATPFLSIPVSFPDEVMPWVWLATAVHAKVSCWPRRGESDVKTVLRSS